MSDLRPFRGVRYDPRAVGDVGAVLCPPYDVIGPDERQQLLGRHPRNAVRLELPEGYEVAARLFAEWQAEGTLRRDERPMVYVYEQTYRRADGGWHSAIGFFCRLRLEEYGHGVRRHERTHAAPKEDRYRLLQAVRANLSPVVMIYDDGAGGARAAELLGGITNAAPAVEGVAVGNRHRLWLADPATSTAAGSLLELASSRPLTIADGHHRYETALRYRDEAGAEHVLVLLFEAGSGGLSVLPTHRLLRGVDTSRDLLRLAGALFEVRDEEPLELWLDGEDGLPPPQAAIGVVTRQRSAVLSADRAAAAELVGEGASAALRRLPVAVIDAALERWTGMPVPDLVANGRIMYAKDAGEAVEQVSAGLADAAFLLPPTPIAAVLEVAAAGELMPQKSTYFEPKAATGLLFNPLADD